MTPRTLILRGLRFHARSHLGVLIGAAIASAVLTGALLVGDSMRQSLRQRTLDRLGWIHFAVAPQDRFFRLASSGIIIDPSTSLPVVSSVSWSTALMLPGTVSRADATARANN